jgi:peptidoglycan/xylan/chitin deacetylase (PgdA/CDA1 family)
MELYLTTTPLWLRSLFKGCVWDIKTAEKKIFLTFDDGPHPEITPFVLAELKKYNAKATFFCIGDNVKKYPAVFNQIIEARHSIGNHTMHHLNGWKTENKKYLKDVQEAASYIESKLFRPPYGRITQSQIKKLTEGYGPNEKKYKIIMWSVLAGDWKQSLAPERCFERIKKKIYPGCVVVLHDSEKAFERMQYTLPQLLAYFSNMGYSFEAL